MPSLEIHQCSCVDCGSEGIDPIKGQHRRLNLLMGRLDEQERRWLAAAESMRIGSGGDTFISVVTGLHVDTIRRGRCELDDDLRDRPIDRVRLPGGGRPRLEKKRPSSLDPRPAIRAPMVSSSA